MDHLKTAHQSAYIVSGTTRGLGRALAEEIHARGHMLYSISRQPELREEGRMNFCCDLRRSRQVEHAINGIMEEIESASFEAVILINNAGVLHPIGAVETLAVNAVQDHFKVNLLSPIHLSAGFIRGARNFQGQRRIINISSGAAQTPYAGWSLYCAAKAALNSFSACAALESDKQAASFSICTVAPGVLDTDMQREIRAETKETFPMRDRFAALHAEGRLTTPRQAAKLLLDLDSAGQLFNGGHFDLRQVVWEQGRPRIYS